MVRFCRILGLCAVVVLTGCQRDDDGNLRDAYERMMTSAERRAAAAETAAVAPVDTPTTVAMDTGFTPPVSALPIDTLPTAAPPPAQDPAPPTPATEPGAFEGTAGAERRERGGEPAILRDVRTAEHDGFDRVVFQFDASAPGYQVEYVDRPIRECGSGRTIPVAGQGWLRVRFTPARAHEMTGGGASATVTARNRPLDLGVVQQAVLTCDFEGQVEWVLGVAAPNRYRLLELREPSRLVVDVLH